MIVQSLLIVLVILVLANFALGYINQVDPPCMNADSYFAAGRKIPSGVSSALGSIKLNTVERYPEHIVDPNVKLAPNGYIGKAASSVSGGNELEGYVNPIVQMANDDSDCGDRTKREAAVSREAADEIDKLFSTPKQEPGESAGIRASEDAEVDDRTLASITTRTGGNAKDNKGRHRSMVFKTVRDGYTSRPGDRDL
jgi:hypothetical protein